jgi:hypothetical protein
MLNINLTTPSPQYQYFQPASTILLNYTRIGTNLYKPFSVMFGINPKTDWLVGGAGFILADKFKRSVFTGASSRETKAAYGHRILP